MSIEIAQSMEQESYNNSSAAKLLHTEKDHENMLKRPNQSSTLRLSEEKRLEFTLGMGKPKKMGSSSKP